MIVRATLPNPTLKLKPGQSAQVLLKIHKSIPSQYQQMHIRDGRGTASVFVQTDKNTFAPRVVVQTGIENFDSIEITVVFQQGRR
ncbi:MAG: hypothetical protein IPJ20_15205 [Flammeovirgaceae bacterium]|nr:hypothetical protein [Flammeovirgaceae bacterium]